MKTPSELRQHVIDLAHAFGVRLGVVDHPGFAPHDALATTSAEGARVVMITDVIDETTYAVALHELGHCLAPAGMLPAREFSLTYRTTKMPACLRDVKLCLMEEDAAWMWAHYYALYWNDLMSSVERMSRDNYKQFARRFGVYVKE